MLKIITHMWYIQLKTIEVLDALNKASKPDDFVVTWWDYGSGCWYYGGLRSFTSACTPNIRQLSNFEILRSKSPLKAAKLARLKTETFVNVQRQIEKGENEYTTAVVQSSRMENQILHFIRVCWMI